MAASGAYNSDRPPSVDVDYASDPASGSFFTTEYKKYFFKYVSLGFNSL